ncbi:hypothetical protein [Actinoallomurus sp. NPDC050550]|uniref:hypothetical protein n=1 Tax=Actinoallomurus sp. NPDC050550 TaxID=3154937 RepID=UPI0033C62F5C
MRAANAALHTEPDAVPVAQLWEWLSADAPRHVRLGAYERLRASGTWTRVHVDLYLIAARDADLGDRAHADLIAWSRGAAATAYRMPPEKLPKLESLLDTAEPVVGAEQAHDCAGISAARSGSRWTRRDMRPQARGVRRSGRDGDPREPVLWITAAQIIRGRNSAS